jgi:hypothetical protein
MRCNTGADVSVGARKYMHQKIYRFCIVESVYVMMACLCLCFVSICFSFLEAYVRVALLS